MEGIYFVVNRRGYGWVEKDNNGNISYNQTWNESKAVKLRTNSDGTTPTLVGLEPLAHYLAEEGNSNGNGVYMIYEIIAPLSGGNSAYRLPERLRDYYKATYPNGLYGCPYSLKAIENGNVIVSGGHYTNDKINLKDSNPDNDGNHIWIESGEFWYSNSTNTRDYVSLQIQKKDHYTGTFDTGYGGFKFKVCKQEADGTYKWVRKVNPNDEHSDVVYGSFNAATELTTQPDGKTEVLRRLESGAKYWFVETAIPTELQDYYTLRTVYEPLTTSKTYETYVFKPYNIDTTKRIKVLSSTAYKFTLLEPLTIYAKKPSGSGTTNVVQSSNGIYTWTGYNPRDYFTIQIEKKNKDGNLLNDMKFAILIEDSTSTATNRKGKWLTADSNGIYKGTLSTYESMKASEGKSTTGVFTTGEKGKLGYTRLIKRIPLPAWGALEKKYTIFEIDAPGYEYLYNVGTFNFNGQSKKGEKLETLTVNDDFRETLNKWPNGYDVNNKRLFNCCIMTCTNQQDFGAIRFRKVDQLTQTPLKGIEIKIKCTQNGNGWLKIEKNKDGRYVVTSREATYDEATPLVTDENGYTVTVWKMPTRVESGGKVIYAAFETYIPEDYQDYFALNADYLEKCPTTNDADLKKYDQFAVYDASTANANAINRAMGWNIREKDYAKALKGCTPEEKIDKNNKKMPEVIEFKKENEQTFIDISGNVWQDTKKLVKNEYQRDDSKNVGEASNDDKNINNITVRLMKRITDKKGKVHTIEMDRVQTGDKKAGCNGDGDYKFSKVKIKDLANYFIEFDYCGMTYEAVIPGYTTEKITLKQNDKTIRKNVLHPDSKTSKATETTDRTDLNNAFGELKGEGRDIINYNGRKVLHYVKNDDGEVFLDNTYKQDLKPVDGDKKTIELNTPKGRKYDYIVTASIDTFKDGNTDKNIIQYYYDLMAHNQTTHMLDGYEKNGHTLLKEIPNLNLGLYLREQPMLSLQKDVYKADMEINGKQFTYRYDGRIKTPTEIEDLERLTGIIGVKFDGKYTLPMYEADLNYTNTTDPSKELKTTVTYKIKLQNSSGVLDSYVHELTDISSKELKIARKNGKPLIYLMDKPDASNEDLENADPIALDGNSVLEQNYSVTNLKGWRSNIRFKNPIKLDNRLKTGGTSIKYLYIVFNINKDDIKEVYKSKDSTNDLYNVVEIASYSVTKYNNETKKDEKYAHVDNNSIPNNVEVVPLINGVKNGKPYSGEDDDDRAPGFKVIKPTQRQITGIVFEDMPVKSNILYTDINKTENVVYDQAPVNKKVDPGEERVGDGIYNTTVGNNMDTNGNGIPDDADKPIEGVKVKLVDSEGNPAKFWNGKEWKTDYVLSKADGTFDMTGFIPGDYHVEFVWGEEAGGKDVSRYKCTILSNPHIMNRQNIKYAQEIKYLSSDIWYKDPNPYNFTKNHYSDAQDDYIRRLAIDKLNLKVADEAYDAIPDGRSLLNQVNELISNANGKTDDSNLKYMHSSTPEITIEVEKIGTSIQATEDNELMNAPNNFNGLGFNIKQVDFGIIERPKRAMSVQKRIKSIKVTTPEGRPIIIATIGIDGKVNAIAGERFISGGYTLGYLYAQIDKNIEQSMKVETEYDITVSALSELDYDSLRYYLFGLAEEGKQLKLKATNLYDYSGGATITSDSAAEDNWQAATTGDKYLKVPDGDLEQETATEKLIMSIYEKVGNNKNEEEIVAALEEMNLFSNYEAFGNALSSKEARKCIAKIYKEFIQEWENENSKYKNNALSTKVIRAIKLENREIVQCNPDNTLVKDSYNAGESRVGTIKTSKIIANGDEIKIDNDVEIASVAVDTDQKTGATPDPTYAPLYDSAEYVTVTPAQGEDKDYIGKAIVGIGILTVLASGIILVKRFINK